ncbi:MAG: glycosyltransferase [Blautia sp.]|nr:glycosyltransferase [Blautia sp.]
MIGHGEYPAAARHGCFSRIRNVIRPDGQAYGGLEGSGLCSFENRVKNLFFYYYFKMKLSVCLIVKNEERVLGRCLFCALQIADELIVVDTGSTDQSREIALEYTDLVYDHPWQDNFAEARSFA